MKRNLSQNENRYIHTNMNIVYRLARKLVTCGHESDIYNILRLAYKLSFIFIICRNAVLSIPNTFQTYVGLQNVYQSKQAADGA